MASPDDPYLQDAEHIRLLVICHYVMAGITALAACLPILHLVMGMSMISGRFPGGGSAHPRVPDDVQMMGWVFVAAGAFAIVVGWTVAILNFIAGRWLSERRRPTFLMVVACLNCLSVPLGTVLGVFTIVVLQRPSVKRLFETGSGELPPENYSNT